MPALTIVIGNKNYSSWSLRGWLAVKHTGLPFDEIKIDLYTPGAKDEIRSHSPAGFVPILKDSGTLVWDSLAIIDYCARLAPEKYWWPEHMSAYATARSAAAEMHSGFAALRTHAPMNFRDSWSGLEVAPEVQADIDRIQEIWTECRTKHGNGGDFLFGGFSAADMMYAPVVSRFRTYSIAVNDTCRAYMEAVEAHPAYDEWRAAGIKEELIVPKGQLPLDATRLG